MISLAQVDARAMGSAILWVGLLILPLAFVGGTFLHAARFPQWVWILAGRTQIMWLAPLITGVVILPIGIPFAIYYLIKMRPILNAINAGDISKMQGESARE